MADKINEIIDPKVYDELHNLAMELKNVSEEFYNCAKEASEIKKQISLSTNFKELDDIIKKSTKNTNDFNKALSDNQDLQSRLSDALNKIQGIIGNNKSKIENLAGTYKYYSEEIKRSVSSLENARKNLQTIEDGGVVASGLKTVTKSSLKAEIQQFENNIDFAKQKIKDIEKELLDEISKLEISSSLFKPLEEDGNAIAKVVADSLKSVQEEVNKEITNVNEEIQRILKLRDELNVNNSKNNTKGSSQENPTSVDSDEDKTVDFSENIFKAKEYVENLKQEINKLTEEIKTYNEEINTSSKELETNNEKYSEIENKIKSAKEYIEENSDNIEKEKENLVTYQKEVDEIYEKIGNAANNQDIDQLTDDLSAKLKQIEYINSIDNKKKEIEDLSEEQKLLNKLLDETNAKVDEYAKKIEDNLENIQSKAEDLGTIKGTLEAIEENSNLNDIPKSQLDEIKQVVEEVDNVVKTTIDNMSALEDENKEVTKSFKEESKTAKTYNTILQNIGKIKDGLSGAFKEGTKAAKDEAKAMFENAKNINSANVAKAASTVLTKGLKAAVKSLKTALKGIPIVGILTTVVSLLVKIAPLIYSSIKKHYEEKKALEEKKQLVEDTVKAQQNALKSTQKEFMQLDLAVNKFKSLTKGTKEYAETIKTISDKLGLSTEFIQNNTEETKKLAQQWKDVRKAQTLSDLYVDQAAKYQSDMEAAIIKIEQLRETDGKKWKQQAYNVLNETGIITTEQAKIIYKRNGENADNFYKDLRNIAADYATQLVNKAQEATDKVKGQMAELEAAAIRSASNIGKHEIDNYTTFADYMKHIVEENNKNEIKLQKKTREGVIKYWEDETKAAIDGANKFAETRKAAIEDTLSESGQKQIEEINKTTQENIDEIKKYAKNAKELDLEKFNKKTAQDTKSAAEYYKGVLKELEAFEDKEMTKTVRGRITKLEKQKAKELAKYKLTSEQKLKVEELYSKKIQEIYDEENRRVQASIAAANLVVAENNLKKLETIADMEGKKGKELTEILLGIEDERYELELQKQQEAFKKETKDVVKNSEEYNAIVAKYQSEEEKLKLEHVKKLGEIRSKGLDEELDKVKKNFENIKKVMIIENDGEEISSRVELDLNVEQAQQELDKFMEMTSALTDLDNQFNDSLAMSWEDSFLTGLDQITLTEEEYAEKRKQILQALGMTEEEYYEMRIEYEKNLAEAINKRKKEEENAAKNNVSAAADIAGAFNSIAESMQDLYGESLGLTIAMQSLSMAQVMMNQGVAISEAIKAAINGSTNWATAVAKIATAVATVVSTMVSAINAVKQSKQSIQEATAVSAYAEGTQYHKGGSAVVGEGDSPELVLTNGKSYVIDKPTLIKDLPVGAKVLPLEAAQMRSMNETDLSEVLATMNVMSGKLDNKERVSVNVGKNVYSYIVKGSSRARVLSKQFSC